MPHTIIGTIMKRSPLEVVFVIVLVCHTSIQIHIGEIRVHVFLKNTFFFLDDQNLLEVQYTPYHMNNRTILDEKCPPGWALFVDTCYTYVAAPMTFYEARDFCRSDNATMPFIRGPTDSLWRFLQRQQSHLRYPEKVWVQDYSYLEKCTAFIYQRTETDDCDTKRGFLCEIDPKVSYQCLNIHSYG